MQFKDSRSHVGKLDELFGSRLISVTYELVISNFVQEVFFHFNKSPAVYAHVYIYIKSGDSLWSSADNIKLAYAM